MRYRHWPSIQNGISPFPCRCSTSESWSTTNAVFFCGWKRLDRGNIHLTMWFAHRVGRRWHSIGKPSNQRKTCENYSFTNTSRMPIANCCARRAQQALSLLKLHFGIDLLLVSVRWFFRSRCFDDSQRRFGCILMFCKQIIRRNRTRCRRRRAQHTFSKIYCIALAAKIRATPGRCAQFKLKLTLITWRLRCCVHDGTNSDLITCKHWHWRTHTIRVVVIQWNSAAVSPPRIRTGRWTKNICIFSSRSLGADWRMCANRHATLATATASRHSINELDRRIRIPADSGRCWHLNWTFTVTLTIFFFSFVLWPQKWEWNAGKA